MSLRPAALSLSALSLTALLAGCALDSATPGNLTQPGIALQGTVYGGQQPLVGAHVYLFKVNNTGYGGPGIAPSAANASVSALNPLLTGASDGLGAYVVSGPGGAFSITGDYTCTASSIYYLYAVGGDSGYGTNHSSGLMAGLGPCPSTQTFLLQSPTIVINEVSTVATAYALAGFASDSTHISIPGNSFPALLALAYASLNIPNLEQLSSGFALTTTPAGNGSVPTAKINTLANILAACVNSNEGSNNCTTLFAITQTSSQDTASAAINIAHNPANSVNTLFNLIAGNTAFQPTLATAPNDYTLAIGFSNSPNVTIGSIAIDAVGAPWFVNNFNGTLTRLFSTGAPVFSDSSHHAGGVAIDTSGNGWITNSDTSLYQVSPSGTFSGPFTGGGLNQGSAVAIDGGNNIFALTNNPTNILVKFNNGGVPLSGSTGYTGGGLSSTFGLAIDSQSNVWVSNVNAASVSKFNNSGVSLGIGANPFLSGGPLSGGPSGVAIDNSNNAWFAAVGSSALLGYTSNGTPLSANGFTGGGLNSPQSVAVDGAGNLWLANNGSSTISEFSNAGVPISPSTGFASGSTDTSSIAVDSAGNVWVGNQTHGVSGPAVTEYIGVATPTFLPLSSAVLTNKLGARP